MYVRQEVKKAFPEVWSPLNLEGKEGLRESFFHPAEDAGIDGVGDWRVGGVRTEPCTFWAGAGQERGSSEEACTEAEESNGSPKQPMVNATFLGDWLSKGIPFYCKGTAIRRNAGAGQRY